MPAYRKAWIAHHNIILTSVALALSTEIEREAAATATFRAVEGGGVDIRCGEVVYAIIARAGRHCRNKGGGKR
jgi:hypothetical protein